MYDSQNSYDLIFTNGQLAIVKEDEIIATFDDRIAAYEELDKLNADS
jgi:hypothetical protein